MPAELQTKSHLLNSFVDESFDTKRLVDFHLSIQVGLDGILAVVLDKEKNKYIAFEYYSFQQVFNFEVITDLLDLAIKESKILPHRYRSVSCSVVNNLSTIVPSALFEEDRKKMYLKFNSSLQGDELVMTDDLKNLEAKNIFALPISLKAKLDANFLKVAYHHFSSGLIESLLSQTRNQPSKKVFVHVQPSHFEVIVIEGKKLLFYNTFNYHTPEDFIYYLLFVSEQMHLNPENMETIFIGEIERSSAIYVLAQKYIRNLKFGERTDNSDYSYQLQTFPKHFYFSLFNNYLS
jgi:hypothetical protein